LLGAGARQAQALQVQYALSSMYMFWFSIQDRYSGSYGGWITWTGFFTYMHAGPTGATFPSAFCAATRLPTTRRPPTPTVTCMPVFAILNTRYALPARLPPLCRPPDGCPFNFTPCPTPIRSTYPSSTLNRAGRAPPNSGRAQHLLDEQHSSPWWNRYRAACAARAFACLQFKHFFHLPDMELDGRDAFQPAAPPPRPTPIPPPAAIEETYCRTWNNVAGRQGRRQKA